MILLLASMIAVAEEPTTSATDVPPQELLATSMEVDEALVPTHPDRSKRPPVLSADAKELPTPEVRMIGGIPVSLVRVKGVKDVEMGLRYEMGAIALAPGKDEFVVGTVGWLQNAGTESYSPSELQVAQDLIGASVWSEETGLNSHEVGLSVPRSDLAAAIPILTSVVTEPSFPKGEVKRYTRESARELIDLAPLSGSTVAGRASFYGWYPSDHPLGQRPQPESWAKVKNKQLLAYHGALQEQAAKSLLVVGDVSFDELTPLLTPLLTEIGQGTVSTPHPSGPVLATDRLIAVDLPGAEQAEIRLVMAAPALGHEDSVNFGVANFIYGGAFLSRLNSNLREDKGLTYGSRSSYQARHGSGRWVVQTDVSAENVAVAVEEIGKEIVLLAKEGPTAEELSGASDVPGWNETLLTAGSAYSLYDGLRYTQETVDQARADVVASADPDADAVRASFERWTADEQVRLWVIVGPRAVIESQLAGLGVQPEWVSPADAVRGANY